MAVEYGLYNENRGASRTLRILIEGLVDGDLNNCAKAVEKENSYDSLYIVVKARNESLDLKNLMIVSCLACLVNRYVFFGKRVILECHVDNGIGLFLKKCHFLELWSYRTYSSCFIPSSDSKIFNLWRLESFKEYAYVYFIHRYFESFSRFGNKDFSAFVNGISEALMNVDHHARASGSAFVISQVLEETGVIETCICDLGIGIQASLVSRTSQALSSSAEALRYAIQPRISSKSTINNMGMGLSNIHDAVESSGGELIIHSGGGRLCYNSGDEIEVEDVDQSFLGTLVYFSARIDRLTERDDNDDFLGNLY